MDLQNKIKEERRKILLWWKTLSQRLAVSALWGGESPTWDSPETGADEGLEGNAGRKAQTRGQVSNSFEVVHSGMRNPDLRVAKAPEAERGARSGNNQSESPRANQLANRDSRLNRSFSIPLAHQYPIRELATLGGLFKTAKTKQIGDL